MKNFLLRTLSGAVYVALIVSAIILLDNSPVAFLCVFGLFTALGINEMLRLDGRQDTESWLVMGVDMLGGVALFVSFYLLNQSTLRSSMWLLPFAVYIVLRFVIQLYRPRQNAVHSMERSFFSLGYVALPVAMLNGIMSITAPRLLLGLFIFIWLYDTGAYATYYWFDEFFQVPDLTTWVGMSVVVAVFATFGDLVESLIKRTVGVKDSGNILPGHGGILDRIDSLLLVVPAVFIYLMLIVPNIR